MKQLFKTGKREFVVDDVPAPIPSANEILIETKKSLISSGTETMGVKKPSNGSSNKFSKYKSDITKVTNYLGEHGLTELKRKLDSRENIDVTSGYSVSGVIIDKGKDIHGFEIGDRVAAAGADVASHAELVSVPEKLVCLLPENVGFTEGSFTTLGSIAMQGVRQARVQVGENVVVVGLGLIGLLTVQILKASGCRVIGVDLTEDRIQFAKNYGMDLGFVEGKDTVVENILRQTKNIGADATIICAATSSSEPTNQAMQFTRKKGRVVIVGAVGMEINRSPFYQKEIEFTISCSYGPGRYDPSYELEGIDYPIAFIRWTENRNMESFLWLISKGLVEVKSLITDTFDIQNAPQAYHKIITDSKSTLAVILNYPASEDNRKRETLISLNKSEIIHTSKDILNMAVIGAGKFAINTYLPNIYKTKNLNLRAVATKSGKNAKKVAANYEADYCTTNYEEILADETIDAIIIASRHDLHYSMASKGIQKKKHTLLEKPMGMNNDEIDSLIKLVESNQTVFSVGYNRRYSPLTVKAKQLSKNEQGPLLIRYRVNAGFIPKESWVQDPKIGGGRIIGECCHFFDLMNFIVGSTVSSISAEYIPVNNSNVVAKDNFCSTIKYDDGSLATLAYTSLGHADLPKENIEIFINGKCIVIDDFKSLQLFGFSSKGVDLKKQNKGQQEQLVEFVNKIKGEPSNLLGLQEAVSAAKMAIEVDSLLS